MAILFGENRYYGDDNGNLQWMRNMCSRATPSADTLRRLALSSDPELRIAIGDDANTSEETLFLLIEDENLDLRFAIAENHNISHNVLKKLSDDSNPYIAERARKTLARLESVIPQIAPTPSVATSNGC